MQRILVFLALATPLAVACSQVTGPGPEAAIVVGHWEWSSSCCSIAGAERTPATEGYTYVLQFSQDGVVEAFRANVLVHSTRFHVSTSRPNPLADPITTVTYDSPLPLGPGIPEAQRHSVFRSENGTLHLNNSQCADCFGDWIFLPRLS
jgi:hypothetical protein